MKKPITGITLRIFKWSLGDCSSNGISSRCTQVTLIGPDVDGPFEPTPDCPAVKLIRRTLHPNEEYVHAEPDLTHPSNAAELARLGGRTKPWFMHGGTILETSDGRFREATGHDYPIKFHDRCESPTTKPQPNELTYEI